MARRPNAYRIRSPESAEQRRQRLARRRIEKRFKRLDVPSPRDPHLMVVLLCLLGMALVAFYLFGPEVTFEEDLEITDFARVDTGTPAAATSAPLDPRPLRQELTDLETALFEVPAAVEGEWIVVGEDVALAAERLEDRLRRADTPRGDEVADRLDVLAAEARAPSFDFATLEQLRRRWLERRRDEFEPAPWLRGAPAPSPDADPAFGAAYRQAAADLQDLVEEALTEIELVVEPDNPAPGAEARRSRHQAWRRFAEGWSEEVEHLQARLPERPGPRAPARLLAPVVQLHQAFARIHALGSAPSPDAAAFEAMVYELQAIQDAFDEQVADNAAG